MLGKGNVSAKLRMYESTVSNPSHIINMTLSTQLIILYTGGNQSVCSSYALPEREGSVPRFAGPEKGLQSEDRLHLRLGLSKN